MCLNNLSKVALDSAEAGIEPAISSRKSNALTTTPPSHRSFNGLLRIYRPRMDERLIGWPIADTLPKMSTIDQATIKESPPGKDRRPSHHKPRR